MEAVLHNEPAFDPFTDEKTFKIAISDNTIGVIGLPLIASLATRAGENVRAAFSVSDPERITLHMVGGKIDLPIDSERTFPGSLKIQTLLEEPFIMVQRKRHPRGRLVLDVNAYSWPTARVTTASLKRPLTFRHRGE